MLKSTPVFSERGPRSTVVAGYVTLTTAQEDMDAFANANAYANINSNTNVNVSSVHANASYQRRTPSSTTRKDEWKVPKSPHLAQVAEV